MRQLGVAQIPKNNPMMKKYLSTISFWDVEGNFTSTLNDESHDMIKPFFCVFYDDMFLGASTLLLDPNSMKADIQMIVGSTGHKKEIEEYFTEELRNIAITEYGATSVSFNGIKEEVSKLVLKK